MTTTQIDSGYLHDYTLGRCIKVNNSSCICTVPVPNPMLFLTGVAAILLTVLMVLMEKGVLRCCQQAQVLMQLECVDYLPSEMVNQF